MLKDREELELHIQERIREVKKSRKKIFNISSYLLEYGIPLGTFEDIVKGIQQVSLIESPVLCLLTDGIYQITGYKDVDPKEWFTENEIETSKKHARSLYTKENRIYLPIAFNDVIRVTQNSYLTKVEMSYLVQMFHSQLIIYKFETQRSAKYIAGRDGIVQVPDINPSSVEDISREMLKENYLDDTITLNIYSDSDNPVEYNEEAKTLIINENVIISILDGFHRLQGGIRAISINSELPQMMGLSIRVYNDETAKRFFGQINTINVVPEQRRKELISEGKEDIVVQELQQKSDLKGKIASSPKISEIAGQLTTFDIMSYAIENVFKPKSNLEAREVATYLIKFYDYLTGSFVDQFLLSPQKYKDTNINHPLMFIGYTVIAKYFQDNNIELKELKNYVENLNLKDEELNGLLSDTKRGINSSALRKKVLKYFNALVESGEKK